MSAKFALNTEVDGKFLFQFYGPDQEAIFTSTVYKSKAKAEQGIASVRQNATVFNRFEIKETPDGKYYFILRARNHFVIAKGPLSPSRATVEDLINFIHAKAPIAEVQDNTVRLGHGRTRPRAHEFPSASLQRG